MMQPSFFTDVEQLTPAIGGLHYIPDFIGKTEESELLSQIDRQSWNTNLKRRVQHYGYRYDYTVSRIDKESWLGPMPEWLQTYCGRLHYEGYLEIVPDQVIINEYEPGQGISAHIDRADNFGAQIASISLGSPALMEFSNEGLKESLFLQPRSLLLLSGEARYRWKHAIPSRKADMVQGIKIPRGRRVSITFRKVID